MIDAPPFSPSRRVTFGMLTLVLAGLFGLAHPHLANAQEAEIQFPITVSTDNANSDTLILGLDPEATESIDSEFGEEEQPPVPPGFDARLIDEDIPASGFGEGLVVDIRQGSLRFTGTKKHEVSFQADNSDTEITISWELPDGVTGTIEDKFGGESYGPMDMSGSGSITVNPGDPEAIVTIEYDGNEAPTIDTNSGLTLLTGGAAAITTEELSASDPDDDPSALLYTATDGPTQGELLVNGTSASSFTQADLQAGNVEYNHTASSAEDDSFTFDLSDSVGPGPTGQTFQIPVEPPMHETAIVGTDGTGNDTGWRLLAPPSSATRGDFEDDLSFDVDSGHLLHTWDGMQWEPATTSSAPLPRGKGFLLYFLDDSTDTITSDGLALDVPDEGEDQNENVTIDGLSRDNTLHLLGNPYDVAFDLGHFAGGDLAGSGFQNTIQIWDPAGDGQWTTITQGEANDNIAAWQGFFVERAQTGTGQTSLTFAAEGRQSGPGDLIGSKAQLLSTMTDVQVEVELELIVESNADTIAQDEVTVLLHEQAEEHWDAFEASQLSPPNDDSYATVNSPLQQPGAPDFDRRTLASEPFPTGNTPITNPLSVHSVGTAGTATLRWPESVRDDLHAEWNVELIDTAIDTTVDLRSGPYSFELEEGDGTITDPDDARFDLRITPTTLPVEVAGLDAQRTDGVVRLTWRTVSETDNAGFYVQRKRSGTRWRQLGFVESNAQGGTTSEPQSYRFTDATLPYAADSLTYRLRQVDIDGTAHVSEETIIRLNVPEQLTLQSPFPNPARQQATIRFGTPTPTKVQIAVYDLLGRRVTTLVDGRLDTGRHVERLSTSSLAPGMYFVRLRAEGTTRTRKLTVVR